MFDADATNIANVEEEVEDLRFLLNPTNPTLPTHSLSFSLSLSLSLVDDREYIESGTRATFS